MSGSGTAAVRSVLARRGWTLSRAGARFAVRRARDGRAVCDLAVEEAPGAGRSLTPAARLSVRPAGTRPLAEADRAAALELAEALGRWLESRRPRSPDAPSGAALAESHDGAAGRDLLLRTTFACNQRCAFCFVPLSGRAAPLADIERALDAQAARSARSGELTLSGGEPTADARLPAILAAARARGFRRVVVQTNAVALSRPGYAAELAAAGARSYLASFHAHEEAAYDRITGTRGQFPRAVAGLRALLAERGCDVTVNVVVNRANVRLLPGLVGFLARLAAGRRGRRPSVYLSMMNEAGHQKAPDWAVDLDEAAPSLRRAVARCRAAGFPVARSAGESSFPPCLFAEPPRHAAGRALAQERVRYGGDLRDGSDGVGRAKDPACRACAYDARCLGVPATYARLFGTGALGLSARRSA